MKTLQKSGGIAALYMAISHLIGIIIFIVVLDYINITDPTQKLAVNIEKQSVIFSTNLLMYVFFGLALIVLSLALYDRMKSGTTALMQVAAAVGVIWAGSLIASGMAANAGLATVAALYVKDPTQAALTFQAIESITNGLGNANGEILGGTWTLLVSLAALRIGGLPKGLNILGTLVGVVGILTIIPALTDFTSLFGLGQIIWFVWIGIVLLRSDSRATA
ncbi:MAG TPA: DUF4386 family protein [Anaerolineales bacterium]|nr:DUF4386 family protein [Anaerolineales bacterium]HNC07758.1 DUF4386 family protein [Anaerolineales bacterium]HND46986.1 DUF4386 family protein [Anaerolineales bacterium]